MRHQSDPAAVEYIIYFKDGKLRPVVVGTIEPWEIHSLDFTGAQIDDGRGTVRTIGAGPDETGAVVFEDGGMSYLHCRHFSGQQSEDGRAEVIKHDRTMRYGAGLILR